MVKGQELESQKQDKNLKYHKMILNLMRIDVKLFKKELKKTLKSLNEKDQEMLKFWIRSGFTSESAVAA